MAFVCSLTAKEYGELNALKARIFRYLKSFVFQSILILKRSLFYIRFNTID